MAWSLNTYLFEFPPHPFQMDEQTRKSQAEARGIHSSFRGLQASRIPYEVHCTASFPPMNSSIRDYWTSQRTRYPAYISLVNNKFMVLLHYWGIGYSTNDTIDLQRIPLIFHDH